jgi:ERCC4-type nuclease
MKLQEIDPKTYTGILVSKSEPTSVVTHIAASGAKWARYDLKVADYVMGNRAFERKEINNFLQSFYSKQLFRQIISLKQYDHPFLILEGIPPTGMTPASFFELKSLYVKLIGYHVGFDLSIIHTPSPKATGMWLSLMWKKMNAERISTVPTLYNRLPMGDTIGKTRMLMLTGIPGVGKKTAYRILDHIMTTSGTGTFAYLATMTEEELRNIKIGNRKLGGKLASRIYRVFAEICPFDTKMD